MYHMLTYLLCISYAYIYVMYPIICFWHYLSQMSPLASPLQRTSPAPCSPSSVDTVTHTLMADEYYRNLLLKYDILIIDV